MTIIEKIAENYRHADYEKTKKLASTLVELQALQSDDQKDQLLKYRIRETKQQKEQRIRLTNPITAAATSPVFAYLEEINRVVGIKRQVELQNQSFEPVISERLSNFYDERSFEDYFFDLSVYACKYDPNAWMVIMPIDDRREMNFYPMYFSSEQIIDIVKDQKGNLLSLSCQSSEIVNSQNVSTYYEFEAGRMSIIKELANEDPRQFEDDGQPVQIQNKPHLYFEYSNLLTIPPCILLGCYRSKKLHYYESILNPAFPLIRDLIRDKSWLDTTKALHTFPRRASYVKECEYDGPDGQCIDGKVLLESGERTECPNCHGSGKVVQSGEQDEIHLKMPARSDQFLDLAKLTYTEQPNIDHPRFLREEVDQAKIEIFKAVYNMETIDKTQTVQTATEIRIEYDKIYNRLAPMAMLQSKAFSFIWRVCAEYMGTSVIVAQKAYPQDYKLKSTSELLTDYRAAIEANAPYSVTSEIYKDILHKEHKDNPEYVRTMLAIENHRPWRDKARDEVMVILQGRSEQDTKRTAWENWDDIATEIIETRPAFGEISYEAQKKIVATIARQITENVSYRVSTPDNIFLDES